MNIQIIDSIIQKQINYLTCPTPTRLMGKSKEDVQKWRMEMIEKQKNEHKRKYENDEDNENDEKNKRKK
jgi:hypothetical protein